MKTAKFVYRDNHTITPKWAGARWRCDVLIDSVDAPVYRDLCIARGRGETRTLALADAVRQCTALLRSLSEAMLSADPGEDN